MEKTEMILELLNYMHWADEQLWESVLDSPSALADDRIKNLFYHVHLVQYAFYNVWHGRGRNYPSIDEFASLHELHKWGAEYYKLLKEYLNNVENINLNANFSIPWASAVEQRTGKPVGEVTLQETLLQVTSHSTYHRGQINARLRELGCEPRTIDYILWVWLGKPEL